MPFVIPTLAETRDFLIAVGKAVFPSRNYGNLKSYHSRRATFLAAAVTQLHSHVQSASNDSMPDTASDDGPIDRWGGIVGIIRKTATPARGSAVGRVLGAPATAVDLGDELIHQASGLRYQIAKAAVVPGGGSVDCDLVAIDVGSQTRLLKGEVLQFVATPAGLSSTVKLVGDLNEDGLDSEGFGAYRARVLSAFSDPVAGGTQADYVRWMLAIQGVTAAYCYPNRAGVGTVDVVALHRGTGSDRSLLPAEQTAVLAALTALAPSQIGGSGGSLRYLTVVDDLQDVEIVLTPSGETAYAFDWTGGPCTVLAWTAGTRLLQFSAIRPANMQAGQRITFKGVGSIQDGREFTIEALSSTDSVILAKAPAVDPVATDLVYSGGPLVTPIRDAIVAHMNGEIVYAGRGQVPVAESSLTSTLGLEVLAYGVGTANPLGKYGPWNGGLILAILGKIATYKGGVRNYSISLPVADHDATDYVFPDDAQIGLITPRSVLVRGAL